jgi:hypothetical protein
MSVKMRTSLDRVLCAVRDVEVQCDAVPRYLRDVLKVRSDDYIAVAVDTSQEPIPFDVRRVGVGVLAVMTLTYLALITPELLDAPSVRVRIVLALAWCLGAVALAMLARLWRHL